MDKKVLLDKDIREPLFDFLEEEYGKTRVFEEKTIYRSRADAFMVVEDALVGIEIKSDADTYTRLKSQVRDYNKFFDYNYVVVGSSHAGHVSEHVPDEWGIITVETDGEKPDFYILRRPEKNTKLKLLNKLQILWRPELVQIQEWNEMPKYKEKSKAFVIEKIAGRVPDKMSEDELNRQISNVLFERDYTTIGEKLAQYREENGRPKRRKKRRKAGTRPKTSSRRKKTSE